MEITPKYLRDEVAFKERFRGYDPDEVDDLIDRVADHIETLEGRLKKALTAAAKAQQAAPPSAPEPVQRVVAPEPVAPAPVVRHVAPAPEAHESAAKLLLKAQKVADETTSDARETASRMVEEANKKADQIRGRAEEEARDTAERSQRQLRVDIDTLTKARAALESDVSSLQDHARSTRERLAAILKEQLDHLDGLHREGSRSAPQLSAADQTTLPPAPSSSEYGLPSPTPAAAPVGPREWTPPEREQLDKPDDYLDKLSRDVAGVADQATDADLEAFLADDPDDDDRRGLFRGRR